ncbi:MULTISPECIES: F510_1955 family glycosylhydrolase [Streptomyces]|uniref:F510_1955 family glycosylhydrolase n=1 Tax=Streptomyces TaxID=1883 RepID=UPI00225A5B95|nr:MULTISPECIES: exo-alpha-sialidase [Streptomyces]MCX5275337.1 exo-alpha-sialidase [Streptomyces virginiae]MCX5582948.1 exo-alpha-sialidase [Streptomyces erythrochromogenes]
MKPSLLRRMGAATLLALTLAACSATPDSPSAESSKTAVSHIHGLGIDPADQRLYVATHDGIFTPAQDGTALLIGDSKDDFMGFTVAKAGTFLASGHPAPGSGGPGNKGLIESTDSGKTWKTRSLAGEVDFHSLDYAHDTIYGYDSTNGLLRVSKDGTAWDDRARLKALDIAVSPADPDTVLATTADGIAKSTDGGRTFAAGRQPVMAFISWAAPDALYGIDASGGLHRSADGGTTWQALAPVPGGAPQALTAVDAQLLLAATQDGVYESRDGGKTFTKQLAVAGGGH